MSDNAVTLLTAACREKYPEPSAPEPPEAPLVDLPIAAMELLTGKFGHSIGNSWSGTLYNGNEDWQVEEVVIVLTKPGWFEHLFDPKKNDEYPKERYRLSVVVAPLTTSPFSIAVNWRETDKFEWWITSARGRKVKSE